MVPMALRLLGLFALTLRAGSTAIGNGPKEDEEEGSSSLLPPGTGGGTGTFRHGKFTGQRKRTTWRDLSQRNYTFSFEQYLSEYGKAYSRLDEYATRKATFDDELRAIAAHNNDPRRTWKKGLNEHTDKSEAEWKAMRGYNRLIAEPPSTLVTTGSDAAAGTATSNKTTSLGQLPASVDWRERSNVVTPVKNQFGCGSCWAFSAAQSIESNVALNTGTLMYLSPQELVDCVPNPRDCGGTGGCDGATQVIAFNWASQNGLAQESLGYAKSHGLPANDAYTYTAQTGTCERKVDAVVGIKGFVHLPSNQYAPLLRAVAEEGPVSISVADASWKSYEEGVFDGIDGKCEDEHGTTISHAVQLVGYGSEGGADYWLVRNSWGTSWGEEGYMKLRRFGEGKEPCGTDFDPAAGSGCKGGPSQVRVCGLCGMLSDSSYPTGGYVGNK